jgi:hypothetical protein
MQGCVIWHLSLMPLRLATAAAAAALARAASAGAPSVEEPFIEAPRARFELVRAAAAPVLGVPQSRPR